MNLTMEQAAALKRSIIARWPDCDDGRQPNIDAIEALATAARKIAAVLADLPDSVPASVKAEVVDYACDGVDNGLYELDAHIDAAVFNALANDGGGS